MRNLKIVGLIVALVSGIGINISSKVGAKTRSLSARSTEWTLSVGQKLIGNEQVPFEFVQFQTSGQTIALGTQQTTTALMSDDLFQNAKIRLKNTSSKTVNSVSIIIRFYAGSDNTPSDMAEVFYGADTGFPGVNPDTWIAPGATIDVIIPSSRANRLTNAINASRTANPSFQGRIHFHIDAVMFDGEPDRMWRKGVLLQRDPTDPKRFNRTDVPGRQISSSGTINKSINFLAQSQRDRSNVMQAKMPRSIIGISWKAPVPISNIYNIFEECANKSSLKSAT